MPVLLVLAGSTLSAQEPISPESAEVEIPLPQPPPTAEPLPTSPREEALEERVRQLEEMVERLSTQMQGGGTPVAGEPAAAATGDGEAAPDVGTPATVEQPSRTGGVGAPPQGMAANPKPSAKYDAPATIQNLKANVKFGPGFEIRSDDDEYILQFHDLTQLDYRGYRQSGHATERDSFLIPRQWWMFSGRMTKPIGYFVSFANGFDSFGLLDVFLDFDFDPRFRIRAGRAKTPFQYEFIGVPTQGMIVPEWGVFFNNFAENRDLGVMAFGRLFNGTFDYMGGIFNGARNGLVAKTDSKFISWFVNYKPFNNVEDSPLQNFNVGGSVYGGTNNNTPFPGVFRTMVPTNGNAAAGVPFLALNNNVRERGPMTFWELHSAWYYRQLAVIGQWDSGFQNYAKTDRPSYHTRIPVQSFSVQGGYLLTGETRSSAGVVKPRNPVTFKFGKFGLGAWELTGRYQYLDISRNVFTAGLADANLWANRLSIVDVGFNWHMTQYLKFMFDWEHTSFNNPVFTNVDKWSKVSDMFVARMQLFF